MNSRGDSKYGNGRGLAGSSDEDLVRLYQEKPLGESGQAAASELFRRYWKKVYLWCLRRTGHHETARDIAQEVLISAYQGLDRFEGRCLYGTWLYTIMKHRCFRHLRRPGLVLDEEVEVDRLTRREKGADAALIEGEDEGAVLELVRRVLEPDEQAAIWLRCFERLPVEEITRRLDVSRASGARGLLQTARRKLRTALVREQDAGQSGQGGAGAFDREGGGKRLGGETEGSPS